MEKRESSDSERVNYTTAKRYSQRKKFLGEGIADEEVLSSIRVKVEHAFHRIKVQFGYEKDTNLLLIVGNSNVQVLTLMKKYCNMKHSDLKARKARYRLPQRELRRRVLMSIDNMNMIIVQREPT